MHKPHKTILVRKIGPGTGRAAVVTKVQRGMQTTRSDDPLAEYALDSRLAGDMPAHMTGEIHTVRDVAVHMSEEIARHAGHPDIAHELLDGQTGPGNLGRNSATWALRHDGCHNARTSRGPERARVLGGPRESRGPGVRHHRVCAAGLRPRS